MTLNLIIIQITDNDNLGPRQNSYKHGTFNNDFLYHLRSNKTKKNSRDLTNEVDFILPICGGGGLSTLDHSHLCTEPDCHRLGVIPCPARAVVLLCCCAVVAPAR